jgi:uncharacterized membrane protein
MSKQIIMPPLLSICILFTIVCIGVIAGRVTTKEEFSIETISANDQILENKQLNESEKVILSLLTSNNNEADTKVSKDSEYEIYVKNLQEYLSKTEVSLTKEQGNIAARKIVEMNGIMDLEKENDIRKMSLDSREIAISLSKEIYETCGLKLTYNLKGEIIRIYDKAGKFHYLNESQINQSGFQFDALMITLVVIVSLLFICVFIAKKHQLYMKDVRYDGFNEERYAQ